MSDGGLIARIEASIAKRRALMACHDLDAYRLVNGAADGIPGLVIERLGDALIVQFHEGKLDTTTDALRPAVEAIMSRLGVRAAYAKYFVRDRSQLLPQQAAAHTEARPWLGTQLESRITIQELAAQYLIRPYDGFSYGLFLEHRDNRRRVREYAKGRRVLNLFCYTCGFSVTAGQGGAREVTSVDLSKRYLDWGRANVELNALEVATQRFICSDTFEFYKRAERQKLEYDLIILDPPTFARMRRPAKTFVLEKQVGPLLAGAIGLLARGGILFFATNNRNMNSGRIDREIHRAAGSRACKILDRPGLPVDFAGDPDYSHSLWVRFD
ncbi:MAG: class I SAM-dependent rRNA methyltransferase [Planctomycetes bacterium]|nr:class I SAM-dependent rRNA methyltransferase [Planctomycetota bacterium]